MQVFHDLEAIPPSARGASVAMGNFDGLHCGHLALLEAAAEVARARQVPLGVVTFAPHPRRLFRPDDPPFLLTTPQGKLRLLQQAGVDVVYVVPFDQTMAHLSAEGFIDTVLHRALGVAHVAVGYDFSFGYRRGGSAQTLREAGLSRGFGLTELDLAQDSRGLVFSSTAIRAHLGAGNPEGAALLLGRPWQIDGEVVRGAQLGRSMGFPTANLRIDPAVLRPRYGVYVVRASVDGVTWHGGVTNIGRRPTVDGVRELVEVHLFDFAGDLYGQELRVDLLNFLRPEQRFPNLDALKQQIATDAAAARGLLASVA
jgi:riboflavin kinase / FMN adenylyltransferase